MHPQRLPRGRLAIAADLPIFEMTECVVAERWFEGYDGDDPDVIAFLAALNAAVEVQPLPVDPDDIWVLWLGACLYIAVPVPPLQKRQGKPWIATDLEVCFWPAVSYQGRGVEAGWGDSGHPRDAQIDVRDGSLEVREPGQSPDFYAVTVLHWLREQLMRPLELHGWGGRSGYRVVLGDSGDIIAKRGRQRWLRPPDVVERLIVP